MHTLLQSSSPVFFKHEHRRIVGALAEENFYLGIISKQLRYMERHCPIALAACTKLLDMAISEAEQSIQSYWDASIERWHSGLYSSRDIQQYLDAAYMLISHIDAEDASRMYKLPEDLLLRGESGTNFMVTAENVAIKALSAYGAARYLTLAKSGEEIPAWLRKGYFLEEYHVTKRFVEMITPMLAHRLNTSLRTRMYQYYAEEVGHEVFEHRTCVALGISEKELAQAYPLPLYTAYVDLFTDLAETDPVGFIASVMITEGMLGGASPVLDSLSSQLERNEEYHRVVRDHDTLNVELHHSSLSRLFMRDVPFISPTAQRLALDNMLLILELNHRALERLFEYYQSASGVYKGVAVDLQDTRILN